MRSTVLLAVSYAGQSLAQHLEAVELQSGDWLGIDGNWSTVKLTLGSPKQTISVLPSTSLSEVWAIGPGGCPVGEVYCASSRGGIYTPKSSKNWSPLGLWQLGLDFLGYGGNGQYGIDSLSAWIPPAGSAGPGPDYGPPPPGSSPRPGTGSSVIRMSKTLVATINTTDYWTGLFGLGLMQGTFGRKVIQSPLTQAVQTYGLIPSYTYGYTAGASYRNAPVSLTLGGVDGSRLIRHQIDFVLSPDNLPRAMVRGIEVAIASDKNRTLPGNWASPHQSLSTWEDNFTALIDSTTPFLWLPEIICDRFAEAFNLTYNKTFQVYTISNEQYQDYMNSGSKFNFTFAFTSTDNHDNFGKPLEAPGTVNITLPIQAFLGLLQYPFANAISYGDPSVPYFFLKKATDNSSFILGRSFLQEAYIVTKYDYGVFKLFQAQYTPKRLQRIVTIGQPNGSPYPPPPKVTTPSDDLTTPQIIGLVVGAVILSILSLLSAYCYGRRRNRRHKIETESQDAKDASSIENTCNETVRASASLMIARMTRNRRGQSQGSQARMLNLPTEAPNSEIHEMAVPQAPIELDATEDHDYAPEDAELRNHAPVLSTYEEARRRMDLQLQGPAPEYSPPADGVYLPPEKKSPSDFHRSSLDHSREEPIPLSPQNSPLGNDSYLRTLPSPSPISPHPDFGHTIGLPSLATTYIPLQPSPDGSIGEARLASHLTSSIGGVAGVGGGSRGGLPPIQASRPGSAQSQSVSIPRVPNRPFQKDPIDPKNIMCVGELPESLQLLRQNIMVSYAEGSDGRDSTVPHTSTAGQSPGGGGGAGGGEMRSFYIDDPEDSTQGSTNLSHASSGKQAQRPSPGVGGNLGIPLSISTQGMHPGTEPPSPWPISAASEERVDGRDDLVHVPQMAANRYSWEND